MKGTIKGLLERVEQLNLEKEVPEIVRATSGTLISLNQKQLFNQGVNADGEVIGTYSFLTEVISKGRKKQGTHYTLYDKGGFFKGFKIKVDTSKITFDSSDYKTSLLEDRLGNTIFGLTKESKFTYIRGAFSSRIKSYIEKTTGLKMTK